MALPRTQPQDPSSGTQVFYSYTILANKLPIGTLQNFASSSSKTVDRIREIRLRDDPRVVDIVPGTTDITISLEQVKIYKSNLLKALGREIYGLEQFSDPIDIDEIGTDPDGLQEKTTYHNCLVSDWGRTITTGTTFIAETATVQVSYVTGKRPA